MHVQRRPLLARLGRRTVLILDLPYVHQLLEAYLSKLFALSYGVASVDVHGADPADHFVHCFTHRSAARIPYYACLFCFCCPTNHSVSFVSFFQTDVLTCP